MDIDKFFELNFSELDFVFQPLSIDRIQLGRLIAFELAKDGDKIQFHTSENIQEELGYSIEEFYLNLKVKDVLDIDTFKKLMEEFEYKTSNLNNELVGEFKFKDSKKKVRWGHIYLNIHYNKLEWKIVSGYILDITARKIKEEKKHQERNQIDRINQYIEDRIKEEVSKKLDEDKIKESQKRHSAVTETIEKIAHQWRQPLNVISLLAQDLYFKINLGTLYTPESSVDEVKDIFTENYNETYDKINSHIQYLSDTVDDFRKHLTDGLKENIDYFNVYDFFQEIEEFVAPSIERENIELINNVGFKFVEVVGIKNNLKQVILNIIHNAQDIFRERNIDNRKIKLYSYFSEHRIHIAISDNAGGIDNDVLPQIFDPYFTTRHETQGTGLGLYMSRELIHKGFNGEIFATNKSMCEYKDECSYKYDKKDDGACFTIQIPNFREI